MSSDCPKGLERDDFGRFYRSKDPRLPPLVAPPKLIRSEWGVKLEEAVSRYCAYLEGGPKVDCSEYFPLIHPGAITKAARKRFAEKYSGEHFEFASGFVGKSCFFQYWMLLCLMVALFSGGQRVGPFKPDWEDQEHVSEHPTIA